MASTSKKKIEDNDNEADSESGYAAGYLSDPPATAEQVSTRVDKIRKLANERRKDSKSYDLINYYQEKYPNHISSKRINSKIIYPSAHSGRGGTSSFNLPSNYVYNSSPTILNWLNGMEKMMEGTRGKDGWLIPDGDEPARRGLRGARERRGKGLKEQIDLFRESQKDKKSRAETDREWRATFDQKRKDKGRAPYYERRIRPAAQQDASGNRERIFETPSLPSDDDDQGPNSEERMDYLRTRLKNSRFPVDLLKLYDETNEWSSSSEEDEDAIRAGFPHTVEEAVRLHNERKHKRKVRRVEIVEKAVEEEVDSLLEEEQQEGARDIFDADGVLKEVIPTSDRGELSEVISGTDSSEEGHGDGDVHAQGAGSAKTSKEGEELQNEQEEAWKREDQERQRHSSSRPPNSISNSNPPNLFDQRNSLATPSQPLLSGSQGIGNGSVSPIRSLNGSSPSNRGSITFNPSPKPHHNQLNANGSQPSHSTPISKSNVKSQSQSRNSQSQPRSKLPTPIASQKSVPSPLTRKRGSSYEAVDEEQANPLPKAASSEKSDSETEPEIQDQDEIRRGNDSLVAIAQAVTASDPRFKNNVFSSSTSQMVQSTAAKIDGKRRGRGSSQLNGKELPPLDLDRKRERVLDERNVENEDQEDEGEEEERNHQMEIQVDQVEDDEIQVEGTNEEKDDGMELELEDRLETNLNPSFQKSLEDLVEDEEVDQLESTQQMESQEPIKARHPQQASTSMPASASTSNSASKPRNRTKSQDPAEPQINMARKKSTRGEIQQKKVELMKNELNQRNGEIYGNGDGGSSVDQLDSQMPDEEVEHGQVEDEATANEQGKGKEKAIPPVPTFPTPTKINSQRSGSSKMSTPTKSTNQNKSLSPQKVAGSQTPSNVKSHPNLEITKAGSPTKTFSPSSSKGSYSNLGNQHSSMVDTPPRKEVPHPGLLSPTGSSTSSRSKSRSHSSFSAMRMEVAVKSSPRRSLSGNGLETTHEDQSGNVGSDMGGKEEEIENEGERNEEIEEVERIEAAEDEGENTSTPTNQILNNDLQNGNLADQEDGDDEEEEGYVTSLPNKFSPQSQSKGSKSRNYSQGDISSRSNGIEKSKSKVGSFSIMKQSSGASQKSNYQTASDYNTPREAPDYNIPKEVNEDDQHSDLEKGKKRLREGSQEEEGVEERFVEEENLPDDRTPKRTKSYGTSDQLPSHLQEVEGPSPSAVQVQNQL